MGSFHRATQLHREWGGLSYSPLCPACSPWPSADSAAWGGQGLWKLKEMLTLLPWIRESREMGRGREERLPVYLLSQPHSSLAGSPACTPGAQHTVSHVRLGAAQSPDLHPVDARSSPQLQQP